MGSQLTGAIGGAVTRIGDMLEEAADTKNSRLQGALALKAGYDAYKLATSNPVATIASDAAKTQPGQEALIGVSASISSSKSRQDIEQASSTSRGTNVQAKDITITARDGDVNTAGAKLQAQDVTLEAAGKIKLGAAVNTATLQSSNQSSSTGVGATLALGGSQDGLSFQASAARSNGTASGSETTYDNTQVIASGVLTLKSGGDTNLQGAQLAANKVKADIGGNLNVETLQDRSEYTSEQKSSGFNLSACVPPLCYGVPVTGSVSSAKQKLDHAYQSATGQSGIAAGTGGFDITVKGNTDLKGGAITSTAPKENNSLTYSDLDNRQSTSASSQSTSLGYDGAGGTAAALGKNLTANVPGNLQGYANQPKNGSESSQTQSVISPGNVTITGGDASSQQAAATLTSRDASTANQSLKHTLTLQQAQDLAAKQKEQQDNQRAAEMLGAVVTNVIGDVAAKQGWADGSAQKLALHGMAGLVQAKVAGGNVAAGIAAGVTQEALAPVLAEYLESNGIPRYLADGTENPDFKPLMQAGMTMAGAVVGAAAGGTQGAATGASVALTGVTNNYLKHAEIDRLIKSRAACAGGDASACQERDSLERLSAQRDAALAACDGQSTAQCNSLRQEVLNAQAEIIRNTTGPLNWARAVEAAHTEEKALSVLSGTDRLGGMTVGVVQSTVDGITTLAKGIATFAQAALGNDVARDSVGQTVDGLVKLSDPETLARVLGAATAAQREELAKAYEAGDAFLIGKIGGEVLAALPLSPVASTKSVGTALKTADQIVVDANNAQKVVAAGRLTVGTGEFSASERFAAQYMADLGNDVVLRSPVGTRLDGGTSDLLVNGMRYDVYTPSTSNPNRIVSAVASKNSQAEGIVLDLRGSAVTPEQLGNVLARVRGAGATNIVDVKIIWK